MGADPAAFQPGHHLPRQVRVEAALDVDAPIGQEHIEDIDHRAGKIDALEGRHVFGKPDNVDGGKERRLGSALIPPDGEGALQVGTHYSHRARAGTLGFDGQMDGNWSDRDGRRGEPVSAAQPPWLP